MGVWSCCGKSSIGKENLEVTGCSLIGSMKESRFEDVVRSLTRQFEERVVFGLEASRRKDSKLEDILKVFMA